MAVKEYWEIKWLKWINVQKDWVTEVSLTDTLNFVWGWSVTDTWWVATINIPQWVTWYREDVTAWSASYTFVNSPATSTSFLVFTDSWTLMFLGVDYTYDPDTETITFLSLGSSEAAYIWVAHAVVQWWWIGDMVKAVYDPTNINSSAFDMDNFIDGTNKHYVSTAEKWLISTAVQPWDNVSELVNNAWYITSADLPTKTSDLQNDSWFITSSDLSWYQTIANLKTNLTDNSNTYYPSQKAVKSYVDERIYSWSSEPVTFGEWTLWFDTSVSILKVYTWLLWGRKRAWDVVWPNSSTNWNIVLFDWATGKLIKDSWLNIQVTNNPTWDLCNVYYDNGTIYLEVQTANHILLENWDTILLENWDKLIME